MRVKLCDLKKQYKSIEKEIRSTVQRVLNETSFINGKDVIQLEKEFARYCGTRYAVGVGSGTDALEISLRVLNIGKGDEVIVPTFTFFSTASAVCYTGAKAVFCDVEEDTGNIDIEKLERYVKRSKKVKAIIPVHLFGQHCNINGIMRIARKYRLKVIEDSCQAHGALYRRAGRWIKAGSVGDTACFSFYPAKNLGAYGDGGIIVTNSKKLYTKMKMLRDCGRSSKYAHQVLGYCKRLDTMQAAILRVKLRHIDSWNKARRRNAGLYAKLLNNSGVHPLEVRKYAVPVYHQYVVRTRMRDRLRDHLSGRGVMTGVHYPLPLHLQPAFRFLGYRKGDFPVSEKLSKEVISLPMYPEIASKEIRFVCKEINKFHNKI